MVRRCLRRAIAVALLVGGLSFLPGPAAHATELCARLTFWDPVGKQTRCLPLL